MDYKKEKEEVMTRGQKEVEAAGSQCSDCCMPLVFGDEIWINLKRTEMLCYDCRSEVCYDYEEGQIVRAERGPTAFVLDRPGCPCSDYLYMVTKNQDLLDWGTRYEETTPYGCCPIVKKKKKKMVFKIRKHKICV